MQPFKPHLQGFIGLPVEQIETLGVRESFFDLKGFTEQKKVKNHCSRRNVFCGLHYNVIIYLNEYLSGRPFAPSKWAGPGVTRKVLRASVIRTAEATCKVETSVGLFAEDKLLNNDSNTNYLNFTNIFCPYVEF